MNLKYNILKHIKDFNLIIMIIFNYVCFKY